MSYWLHVLFYSFDLFLDKVLELIKNGPLEWYLIMVLCMDPYEGENTLWVNHFSSKKMMYNEYDRYGVS